MIRSEDRLRHLTNTQRAVRGVSACVSITYLYHYVLRVFVIVSAMILIRIWDTWFSVKTGLPIVPLRRRGGLFLPRFRVKTGLPGVPPIAGRAMCTKIQSKDRPTSSYRHAESSDFTCIIYTDLLPLYRVSYMFMQTTKTYHIPSHPKHQLPPSQIGLVPTENPVQILYQRTGEILWREICRAKWLRVILGRHFGFCSLLVILTKDMLGTCWNVILA